MDHVSVLSQEVIASLIPKKGGVFVDATFGGGGHSRSIARLIGKTGRLIAFDADETVFAEPLVRELTQLTDFTPIAKNFRSLGQELRQRMIGEIDGALFDLGLSSIQLEASGRGFSFQRDEPLLMTFAKHPEEGATTASAIVNGWKEENIIAILRGFGEERFAGPIARAIVKKRKVAPILVTSQLVEVIHQSTPDWYHRGKTHFATRTFQALRMAVNDEFGAIEAGISSGIEALRKGGRMAIISFHSGEDRLVKNLLRKYSRDLSLVTLVNKKPIVSSQSEMKENPRSRSAKLRVLEKL